MTKKKKKKNAGVGIDFSKVKTKVGKRIKKNAGETRINPAHLKTTTLRIAHQNALEYDNDNANDNDNDDADVQKERSAAAAVNGNRGAALKPLAVLLTEASAHPSAAHRRRCVEALAAGVAAGSATKESNAGLRAELLRVVCLRLADESGAVRKAARALVDVTIQAYAPPSASIRGEGGEDDAAGTALAPFVDGFASQLAGCIANPTSAVQKVALDATSTVLASPLGAEMTRDAVAQLVSQVGVLLAGSRSSNMHRGVVGGIDVRLAQLECVRCGALRLQTALARRQHRLPGRGGVGGVASQFRDGEHDGDDHGGEYEHGDAEVRRRRSVAWTCLPWYSLRARAGLDGFEDDGNGTLLEAVNGAMGRQMNAMNASAPTAFDVPRLVADVATCFAECCPADLESSPEEVQAMMAAGTIDCMVASTRCLCALIKYMEVLAGIERTNMGTTTASTSATPRVTTASIPSSLPVSWTDACASSLDAVQRLVLPHVPVFEPLDINIRVHDFVQLRSALETLNLASLELLAELARCQDAIQPQREQHGKETMSAHEGHDRHRAVGASAVAGGATKMVHLACEAMATGNLLLRRAPQCTEHDFVAGGGAPPQSSSVASRAPVVCTAGMHGEQLTVVMTAIRHLLAAAPRTSTSGVQYMLMEALCTRIEANIVSSSASDDNYAYLQVVSELMQGVLLRSEKARNYEEVLVTVFCDRLAARLPQALWELRTRAPRSSRLWLDILLAAARVTPRSTKLRVAIERVMHQLAPLVAFKKRSKAGTGTGTSVDADTRAPAAAAEEEEETTFAIGPLVKLPPQCRTSFVSALYYLPPPLPRPFLRSLAVAILSPSTDAAFAQSVVRTIGLRGRRISRSEEHADDRDIGDDDDNNDGGGIGRGGHDAADERGHMKEEIQSCTSFIVSILCGRLEGVAASSTERDVDGHLRARCWALCREASHALCEWIAPEVVLSVVVPKVEALGTRSASATHWTTIGVDALREAVGVV